MAKENTQKLVLCALFAALTCVLGPLSIPISGFVPLSLATLSVLLAGGVLGLKWGVLSQAVYLLLGLAGLPVFSGFGAGPAKLFGPTGGYLVGYLALAALTGLFCALAKRHRGGKRLAWVLLGMLLGTLALYALGTAWFMLVTHMALVPALFACVLPFLPGDAVKIVVAGLLSVRLSELVKKQAGAAA